MCLVANDHPVLLNGFPHQPHEPRKVKRTDVEAGVDSQVGALRDAVGGGSGPIRALRGPRVDRLTRVRHVDRERVIDGAVLDLGERDDTGSVREARCSRAPTRGGTPPRAGVVIARTPRDVPDRATPCGVPAIRQAPHFEELPQLVARGLPDGHLRIRPAGGLRAGGMGTALNARCKGAHHDAVGSSSRTPTAG